MKSLALVTPWPPQQSGIADYCFDLAKFLLRAGVKVSVYTTAEKAKHINGITIVQLTEGSSAPDELLKYDHIIYQLGNSPDFHLWMTHWMKDYPGIVQLHDVVLHHLLAYQLYSLGHADSYLESLEKWYGREGLELGKKSLESHNYIWENEEVINFPLFEEYLQHAECVLVHSLYALKIVRSKLPSIPCFKVEQLYDIEARQKPSNDLLRIAILGGVGKHKRLDWVMEALTTVKSMLDFKRSPLRVDVVGSIDASCAAIVESGEHLSGAGLEVVFTGRASDAEFEEIMVDADLVIALRHPTMGETSAIVMRAIQYGVPVIVNETGWYRELPDKLVKKIPINNAPRHLAELLFVLLTEKSTFSSWSKYCLMEARKSYQTDGYGEYILTRCAQYLTEELVLNEIALVLKDCGIRGDSLDRELLSEVIGPLQQLDKKPGTPHGLLPLMHRCLHLLHKSEYWVVRFGRGLSFNSMKEL